MRSKTDKRIPSGITYLLLSACVFWLASSCHAGKKKWIIPEKKLVQVLIDVHLADGIGLTVPYSGQGQVVDSASLYDAVFRKHNINRAMFDSTLAFYTRRPDRLQTLYGKVNNHLSKMDSDLNAGEGKAEDEKKILIWQDSKTYILPQMGNINKVEISLPVSKPGFYTVSAKIRLFDDDQTVAPRITLFFWHENGSPTGFREYFRSSPVARDGKTGTYTITHKLVNPKITHIKGFMLDHSNPDSLFTKHAMVSEIKVYFRE